ncbi:TetR/AcrR family transcriptional regulator C-terminal domain-containing protein [Nocardia puris]|uniref:TetR/AcrR family transcriptional regulator n=1 Tax=Nocardia puris TaxID=208602 RepID=UPI00189384FA|nr:TetR/AcrR family transcriptional regulator C-terminal domain-containing protein [Nocardia puris]MBF6364115.1 TetR/AcrR family transcriptional regulator C-terminal domain-containing protein [Nocardia puris]MBF6459044.1 TetR/AcrR family transcriptional regulator C-terminal domain-containing protein [Nocardia puris]
MPKSAERAPLSRERVLRAALRYADEHGLAALSMRKLAQELGVEAMSLYNHVAGKDDLLDGLADLVVAEIAVPEIGGDWKAAMRARAHSARAALRAHPWASGLISSRVIVGPAMLRYIDATLGCLHAAGFTYIQADRAWNAMDSHIYGFTLQENTFPLRPDEYATAAAQFLLLIPESTHPHMNALSRLVIDGTHPGPADFDFGLNLLLDGLDRLLTEGK